LPYHANNVDVLQLLAKAVTEIRPGIRAESIRTDTVIADLGIDSISLMEVIGILEDELRIVLSDEEVTRITTVADLERIIHKKRAFAKGAG